MSETSERIRYVLQINCAKLLVRGDETLSESTTRRMEILMMEKVHPASGYSVIWWHRSKCAHAELLRNRTWINRTGSIKQARYLNANNSFWFGAVTTTFSNKKRSISIKSKPDLFHFVFVQKFSIFAYNEFQNGWIYSPLYVYLYMYATFTSNWSPE